MYRSTAEPSDAPVRIPDEAMLQAADLHGGPTSAVEDQHWPRLRPPRPGAEDTYPSTASRRVQRTLSAVVTVDEMPTVVVQYVAVYHSNGAHRCLRDLRRALDARHGVDDQGGLWTILATHVAGPESLLLRLREDVGEAGENVIKDTYIALTRVGRVLIAVSDTGWGSGSGDRGLVEELIIPAVRRARILL